MLQELIQLNELTFQRANGFLCADKLNFTLYQDQKVAITGSNGCGKSTLLMALLGLLKNVQGDITLFGEHCRTEKQFAQYRTRIGLLFQDSDDQLFSPTVLEDVCFGPVNQGYSQNQAEKMALEVLLELGIEELADCVSYQLSGGQKKLVSLASVLVMDPQILLLDEPSNGLDEKNYQMIIDKIKKIDLPIILVSHDKKLREALTDIEYRLQDGKLFLQDK